MANATKMMPVDQIASEASRQKQGSGNCYFWAALNALSRVSPEFLSQAVKKTSATGYEVQLYRPKMPIQFDASGKLVLEAKPSIETVNSNVSVETGEFGFWTPVGGSQGTPKELMLEKTLGKLAGGMEAIANGGLSEIVVGLLTGSIPQATYHREATPGAPLVPFEKAKETLLQTFNEKKRPLVVYSSLTAGRRTELLEAGICPSMPTRSSGPTKRASFCTTRIRPTGGSPRRRCRGSTRRAWSRCRGQTPKNTSSP